MWRRPLTLLWASSGRCFCRPSSKQVWMLKEGLKGPRE